MVKFKEGKGMAQLRKRIKELPSLTTKAMEASTIEDAYAVMKLYRAGIGARTLRLKPLRPGTVKRKERVGMERPDHPLYGLGFDDPDSLVNALEVSQVGPKGWRLRPRNAWHHGRKAPGAPAHHRIKLRNLFDVHEFGATIKNAFGKGIVVRIPPRPALRYAFRAFMDSKEKRARREEMKKAIRAAVARGDRTALARIKVKQEAAVVAERARR